ISFLQGIRLVFVDRLPIHFGAIGAALVTQRVIAAAHIDDRRVQARNRQVFEENVAFAATPDAQTLFAHFIGFPRLFSLLDPHITQACLGRRWIAARGTQHSAVCIGIIKRTRAKTLLGLTKTGCLLWPRGNWWIATRRGGSRRLGIIAGPRGLGLCPRL